MKYYIMGKKTKRTTYIRIESRDGCNRNCFFDTVDFDPEYHLNKKINYDKLNSKYDRAEYYYHYYVDLIDFDTNEDIAYVEEVELDREFHSGYMYKLKDKEYRGNVVYNSELDRWEIHIDYTVETVENENNTKVKELYDEYNRLLKEYYDTKESNDKLENENKDSLLAIIIKDLFGK